MNTNTLKNWIIVTLTMATLILSLVVCKQCSSPKVIENIKTVEVRDTVYKETIKEKTKIEYVTTTDTFIVYNNDTVYINLPIEHKTLTGNKNTDSTKFEYEIKYSGYKAEIDTITYRFDYTYKPLTIKKEKPFKQFIGIGLGVNYGLCVNPYDMKASFQPNISIGVVYGFGYTW